MDVLTWGSLSLSVGGTARATITEWQRKAAYKTETKENGTGWPKTQLKGPELGTISFSVLLSRSMGVDVRAELDKWESACNAGKAAQLKLGGKVVGSNKWMIKDVQESEVFFDSRLNLIGATMKVSFSEYASAGSTASTTKKKTTKKKTASKKVQPSKKDDPAPAKDTGVDITQKYISLRKNERAKRKGMSGK
ncbi:MAG: phage tail protein [Clostridiales bacterium]|nr:phage tail protein [Clostridiales bacterium]